MAMFITIYILLKLVSSLAEYSCAVQNVFEISVRSKHLGKVPND